jgi:hypothetical protein
MEKLWSWKGGMEEKGLRVNVNKTKVMRCTTNVEPKSDAGKYPVVSAGKEWGAIRSSVVPVNDGSITGAVEFEAN